MHENNLYTSQPTNQPVHGQVGPFIATQQNQQPKVPWRILVERIWNYLCEHTFGLATEATFFCEQPPFVCRLLFSGLCTCTCSGHIPMHLLAYYLVVFLMYRHSPHDIRMIQSCPSRMCWQHAGQDVDEDVVLPDLTIFNNRIWKGSPVSEWWVKKELNLNFMITIWQTRGQPYCICSGGGQENNAVPCQSTTWYFSTVVEGFFSVNWLNCWSGEKHFKSSI